ncbi:MAG TPA: peptide chain release factor 2 [bacterium]|nr:peptide chain release factor 2 [bacterium]
MIHYDTSFDLDARFLSLKKQVEDGDLWQSDQETAVKLNQQLVHLEKEVNFYDKLADEIRFFLLLTQSDEALSDEDNAQKYAELDNRLRAKEWLLLLNGPYDKNHALLSIHAGTGGVDAQDWAEILLRMYLRFAEKQGWEVTVLNKQMGNEAGIKHAELYIKGDYVYGNLRSEHGIHRLVRISPFDAEAMRHTSFASVEVEPELPELDLKEFTIPEKDIRVEVFRSGGAGGQSVNTTDSAVRMVHLPTGISVACQNERSQLQNRLMAENLLKSRVFYFYKKQEEAERAKMLGQSKQASWGNQIRSYVMQPYQQVKDHRSDWVTTDIQAVLDGDLEDFVKAYLRWGMVLNQD